MNLNNNTQETEKKPRQWTRTTFNFFDGKAWCWREVKTLDERNNQTSNYGYYCYNCKNELFFKPYDNYKRDNPPFRFHKLLVKKLEKKGDDWRTGRKTHVYYAFCCKCSVNDTSDGKITKKWGKLPDSTIEKCDCQGYLFKELNEHSQSINSYESMIADCRWLITQLEELKRIFNIPEKDFKESRINDFISQLKKRNEDAENSQKHAEEMLNHVKSQEVKYKKMFSIELKSKNYEPK